MAFLKSKENQQPALCQYCDLKKEELKCINCAMVLCKFCSSKIHSKCKSFQGHIIINIKDCGTEKETAIMRKVDLQNIPCTIHSEHKVQVYCNDCCYPICSECIIESHHQHECKKLHEVFDTILVAINAKKGKLEKDIHWYGNEIFKFEQLLSQGNENFLETKDTIIQAEKELKERVSRYTSDILKDLETNWRPIENNIKAKLSILSGNKDGLVSRKGILDEILVSHQFTDVFSAGKTLNDALPNISHTKIQLRKTKFIQGNISKKVSSQLTAELGSLLTVPDFELINTYQTELCHVENILHNANENYYISCWKDEKLQEVRFQDGKIEIGKSNKIKVYNMARQQNGDLIISSGESDLKLFSNDGQSKTLKCFSPLKTLGIHVNKSNQIIVGLSESDYFTDPTKESVRKFVIINQQGNIIRIYEHDKDNQRLISWPRRIATVKNNIIVVDLINDQFEGSVVLLNYKGEVLWTYNGSDSVNSDKAKFTPRDIAVSSNDMIVVSDTSNPAIYILSHTGEIILCKEVKSLGIKLPYSLHFDQNMVLWIGCDVKKEDENKAKVHALKLL